MKTLSNIQKAMIKAIILFACLFALTQATAQSTAQSKAEYIIKGNEIVKVQDSTKATAVKTTLIYKIKNVSYPVYKSVRGSYYIIRTSKKTGKEYKQYFKLKK